VPGPRARPALMTTSLRRPRLGMRSRSAPDAGQSTAAPANGRRNCRPLAVAPSRRRRRAAAATTTPKQSSRQLAETRVRRRALRPDCVASPVRRRRGSRAHLDLHPREGSPSLERGKLARPRPCRRVRRNGGSPDRANRSLPPPNAPLRLSRHAPPYGHSWAATARWAATAASAASFAVAKPAATESPTASTPRPPISPSSLERSR